MGATAATAGVFPGKSLAVSRVFLINDVERRQADVRDFLIPQRDFGFHRQRVVPRQSLLRVRHGRLQIWPPSGVSMYYIELRNCAGTVAATTVRALIRPNMGDIHAR
jgi:hypothetical protein